MTFALGAVVAGTTSWFATRPTAPGVERFAIEPHGAEAVSINLIDRDLAITPDGSRIVYVGDNGNQLFVRTLDQLVPTPLARGVTLRGPAISPDGQWVAFVDTNTLLRKVAITGGPAVQIATTDVNSRGVTWLNNDTIVFAGDSPVSGLQRVAANGGPVTVITSPDHALGELDHIYPEALPDGRHILYTVPTTGRDAALIAVLDVTTGESRVLLRGGSHAHYVPTGHLVYAAAASLQAVAFDLDRLETRGVAVSVLSPLVTTASGGGDFSISADGTLIFAEVPGVNGLLLRTLVWVDREGKEQPLGAPARAYVQPRVSPDGSRVAVYATDQEDDTWVWDLHRATLTRLTSGAGADQFPVWTPNSREIFFSSVRTGAYNIYRQTVDGAMAPVRVTESPNVQYATSFTPDGTKLVIRESRATQDLLVLTPGAPSSVQPLVATDFIERNGEISPDGRWLAYESDNSRRFEIYVRPFPNVDGGQWQVSTSGGTRPVWARNGRELFYMAPDGAVMGVRVDARGSMWGAASPTKILNGGYFTGGGNSGRAYDVSPDGRFLMIKQAGSGDGTSSPQIVVVRNWFEELKRLVPVR